MKQRKKQENEIEDSKTSQEVKDNEASGNQEAQSNTTENKDASDTQTESESKIADLQQKYDEINDKYLRLYSDFDNFRKRAIKERIELSKTASEQVLIDFLSVLDDMERAVASFENVQTVEPIKEGTSLIYNKFKNNLIQKGLSEIDALGKPFDTDYHEAIAHVPAASDDKKNLVIDVTQKGYTLNGKVIRFAKVVVSK